MTDDKDRIKLPMSCIHGDAKAEVELERARVREILAVDEDNELYTSSSILYALSCWFKGRTFDLEYVLVDQWMAVGVMEFVYGEMKYGDKGRIISAECDTFEDGLARIFLYIHDNYERDE